MSLYFKSDTSSLMCRLQSRERWSSSEIPLDTCLGEKTESQPNYSRTAPAQQSNSMIGAEMATLVRASSGHQEGWTECFQDLQTWCPLPQDELNTPQVTSECFNFGTIDQYQVRDLDDLYPGDLMPDTLGGDMAYLQSTTFGLDEDKNNNTPPYLQFPQSSTVGDSGKTYTNSPTNAKSPLKSTSANILLSQSILSDPQMKTESGVKYHSGAAVDQRHHNGMMPFDLAEDEENFLSVPPAQVAKRGKDFRVPSRSEANVKKEKPKLKLDVTLPTVNPPSVVIPSTPEVQNELVGPKVGFDLIQYVVSGDYVNVGTVSEVAPNGKHYESVVRDHDYVEPVVANRIEPSNDTSDPYIKREPLSPASCAAAATLIDNKILTTERGRPLKRRRDSDSDYIFGNVFSDVCTSDDSADWEPFKSKSPKKVKKSKTPKSSLSSVKHEESDAESVASSLMTDKYRELRDKNNEASRRSRLNRKQRDQEMRQVADKLESQNRALRARASRMQKLVLDMREIIMKTIKGANKR